MMGRLVFLTLPIGNLKDLTKRVEGALKEGIYFAVEDSRTFLSLLELLGISSHEKKWAIWHDQSKEAEVKKIDQWIEEGHTVYVVSEAGSPYISDPGYDLLQSLKHKPSSIDTFGGVSAVVSALELSQLPPIPFSFHGFLARQTADVKRQLEKISNVTGTHIFFLSPHRLIQTVEDVIKFFNSDEAEVKFCLVREISKKFQETITFTQKEWESVQQKLVIKGEFVFLIYRMNNGKMKSCNNEIQHFAEEFLKEQKPKKLAKLLSEILGKNPSEVYEILQKKN